MPPFFPQYYHIGVLLNFSLILMHIRSFITFTFWFDKNLLINVFMCKGRTLVSTFFTFAMRNMYTFHRLQNCRVR